MVASGFFVIITLDPWRDAPEQLPAIVQHWQLGPHDRVLSGPVPEVDRVLDELGVARRRDPRTGDIVHTSTVMLLDEKGSIAWRVDGSPVDRSSLLQGP